MEQIHINEIERTVSTVTPLADYKLLLEYDDGEKRIFDVAPLMKFQAFSPLADEAFYRQVRVISGCTVGWDNIDICPDCLYSHSTPFCPSDHDSALPYS